MEAPSPPKRVNVATLTLAPQSLQLKIEFVGKLLPNERVDVHNELAGVVEQVKFEEGEKVSKGRVLAHISTKELTVRRDMAQADFQLAEINYQRNLQLDSKQLIARSILDQSRTQRQLAKYNWELAEVQLQKSLVKAPISGVVKVRRVEPGEYLKVGMKLSEILDLRKMRVELDVPELDISKLQKGQTVKIELYAEPGKLYDGKIHRIGVEADTQTRSFPVEVQMANPNSAYVLECWPRCRLILVFLKIKSSYQEMQSSKANWREWSLWHLKAKHYVGLLKLELAKTIEFR